MSYKLVIAETEPCGCYECYYECTCDSPISIRDTTLSELKQSKDYDLRMELTNLVLDILENGFDDETINQNFRQRLSGLGWVNEKELKEREEKLETAKKYYLVTESGQYRSSIREIDLGALPQNVIRQLARSDTQICQAFSKVSLKKLLDDKQKRVYTSEAARLKKEKEKKAEAARKRREKKKQKEIEKAKRILAEAEE